VLIEHNRLAVEDEALGRQLVQCLGNLPMPSADVLPVPREEPRRSAVANRNDAETVVLDLELPIVAVKCRTGPLYDLQRKSPELQHATILRENRVRARVASYILKC
jgi:hypothetical protein